MMLFQSSSRIISFAAVGSRRVAAPKAAVFAAANSSTRHGFDVLFLRSSVASSSYYNSTVEATINSKAFLSTSTTSSSASTPGASATSDASATPGSASANASILSKLCHVNISILRQKLSLIEVLKTKFGVQQAKELYKKPCPLVGGASIGQHLRHSVDHIEKIVNVLRTNNDDNNNEDIVAVVRYDIRTRGGTDEHDIDQAQKRIERIMNILQRHVNVSVDESSSSSSSSSQQQQLHKQPMKSCFMLSGNESNEYELDTTLGRELGFVVHHAIHHLALVKVIVTQPTKIANVDEVDDPRCNGIIGLSINDLPTDFGTAPSTTYYNNNDQKQQ